MDSCCHSNPSEHFLPLLVLCELSLYQPQGIALCCFLLLFSARLPSWDRKVCNHHDHCVCTFTLHCVSSRFCVLQPDPLPTGMCRTQPLVEAPCTDPVCQDSQLLSGACAGFSGPVYLPVSLFVRKSVFLPVCSEMMSPFSALSCPPALCAGCWGT